MYKLCKWATGILLLPLAYAISLAFAGQLQDSGGFEQLDRNTWWFIGGFVTWILLFFLFPRPIRTYVLAHELTHALWGMLMGAKVSRLRVSGKGGSVTLDKSNILITLAPYFFPFYTVLAVSLYALVRIWWDTPAYLPFWHAVFGLTWAFHLTFTVHMLGIRQPDIQEHGRVFSYVLIYCINVATAALLANLLTDKPLRSLGTSLWDQTGAAYLQCAAWIRPWLASLPSAGALF